MIVNGDFTAGQTIEDAVREALEFAERNNCMVRAEMNGVHMLFFSSPVVGKTMEDRINFFTRQYREKLKDDKH
jgi:hypothetical protein